MAGRGQVNFTVTREDIRQDYGEARLVCFGLLAGEVVVMVYTERPRGPHVISLRKAEKHETRYYRQVAKENLD
nr:BrnT family toxin [Rhodoferax sp.]